MYFHFILQIGRLANDGERRHNKGCNCKRSGCLKNYCECYEAKIPCTDACKCIGCKNVEEETANYERAFANPLKAAERGYVDDIIEPSETRARIINALQVLETKDRPQPKRRHDNLPL